MPITRIVKDPLFNSLGSSLKDLSLPEKFTFLVDGQPHQLCRLAANSLQNHLKSQNNWVHNFGLNEGEEGAIIGKMFGVLVVKNQQNELGYLAAFSGKLAGGNHHTGFVPPVFDSLDEDSFLNQGMKELTCINDEIKQLKAQIRPIGDTIVSELKFKRRNHSFALQQRLFNEYHFLNRACEPKNLKNLFSDAGYKNPPAGAGECAGPKLLQYAFQHQMEPIAIAEFWWGKSPKSDQWQHGQYYPCCREKCAPILAHMLEGIDCSIQ